MWTQIMRNTDPFLRLRKSKFRRSFDLDNYDKKLIDDLGLEKLEHHIYAIIEEKLQKPQADGTQTPYTGHPVFKAQHATATCCRVCMFKYHRISKYRDLTAEEKKFIANIITRWISSKYCKLEIS